MDDGGIRAAPLRERSIWAGWDVSKRGTGNDLEEGMVHFLVIRLEVALDIDDESGCDRGEQTGLFPLSQYRIYTRVRKNAHKDMCCVQVSIVFLDKGTAIIVSCALKLIVELGASVSGSCEVCKRRRQYFKHGTSKARDGKLWGD